MPCGTGDGCPVRPRPDTTRPDHCRSSVLLTTRSGVVDAADTIPRTLVDGLVFLSRCLKRCPHFAKHDNKDMNSS